MPDIKSKIEEAIKRLDLDLRGKVVLTEAATGAYIVTPVLAAAAGAEVYAFTRDTRYGSAEEVKRQTLELASRFESVGSNLNVITELSPEIISKADIITNSGHLRPLDTSKLQYAKKGAVIPLMYEAWEWRDADLDIAFCNQQGLAVGATNERHPDVDVFNYLGDMALKMIFDAGLCPYNNKFILICNNDFGPFIAKVLSRVCGALGVCDLAENRSKYDGLNVDWVSDFPEVNVPEKYRNCEAVLFTAYPFDKPWIGPENLPIPLRKLKEAISGAKLLRYAGDIDEEFCAGKLDFYPVHVHSGHMGILPSAIGPDPIVRLQSGGLKVGELMLKQQTEYRNIRLVDMMN